MRASDCVRFVRRLAATISALAIAMFCQRLLPGCGASSNCPRHCECSQTQNSSFMDSIVSESFHIRGNYRNVVTVVCKQINTDGDLDDLVTELTPYQAMLNLHIRQGQLRHLSTLCCVYQIRELDVAANQLQSVDMVDSLPLVVRLDLSSNRLTAVTRDMFRAFPNIQVLRLDSNKIEDVHAESFLLWHLRELDLSNNQLTVIHEHTFRYCAKLQVLNLRNNRLTVLRQTTLYFSSQLTKLDLSFNQIGHIEHQAFTTLTKLRLLDFSNNRLSRLPTEHIRHLERLESLYIGGNNVTTINAHSVAELTNLRYFDISHSTHLRLVLSGAFTNLATVRVANFTGCPRLAYVSPTAFLRCAPLEMLDVGGCALRVLSAPLLRAVKQIDIASNPNFDCACTRAEIDRSDVDKVLHAPNRCFTDDNEPCRESLYLWPKGVVQTTVGETVYLHCTGKTNATRVRWRNAEGEMLQHRVEPTNNMDNLATIVVASPALPRVESSDEFVRFDFVKAADTGRYTCTGSDDNSLAVSVDLAVRAPAIQLFVLDVRSTEASFAWNATMHSHSARIRAYLIYKQLRTDNIPTMPRIIQLPMENPWYSYTVNRLRAQTNYSFCLTFVHGRNDSLFETCCDVTTLADDDLGNALFGYTLAGIAIVIIGVTCLVSAARCLHRRFYIWQEEKYRSRIAMSVSGQSFLSSADSLHTSTGRSVGFENIPMSASSYSSNAAAAAAGTSRTTKHNRNEHVTFRDMAL